MKTFAYTDPTGAETVYVDPKRHMWLASVLIPLIGVTGIGVALVSDSTWPLWIPMLVVYLLLPLLDHIFGADQGNPPEQVIARLENDNYYRNLLIASVPLYFLIPVINIWFLSNHATGWAGFLAVSLSAGLVGGLAINVGHELGHKRGRMEKVLARFVLAVPAYGHFSMEHNAGHHAAVATPEDSASARFGESIYRFALREIPGGIRRGWQLEARRLARTGKATLSSENRILQSLVISMTFYAVLIASFGSMAVVFLIIYIPFAWWQLTNANYVEHYGLLRLKTADNQYEPCQPRHSWNANHIVSNLVLFHLERHSDHHAFPARHYQSLRNFEDAPQLPSGYFGMFVLASIPMIWRRVMDHRVLELAGRDLAKVNLGPAMRAMKTSIA